MNRYWRFFRRRRDGATGQALPILVGGMVAILALTALVIDGGNVWAQQRATQNGADAAAKAGAMILARRLADPSQLASDHAWDVAVEGSIQAMATANDFTLVAAYYTDICGIPLTSSGTAALNADHTVNLAAAAQVGSGIPSTAATNPDCPNFTVGPPAGVLVVSRKTVRSYVAGVVGITQFQPTAQSTAVSGYLTGFCDSTQGQACSLLPIAIPVNIVTCDGQNNPLNQGTPWDTNTLYKIPLCKNGPGNVGWLDWSPPSGGTQEIVQEILHPDNPPIVLPSWNYVAATGNVNASAVENAVNTYDGQVVLVPQFDLTCNPGPGGAPVNTQPDVSTKPDYGCPHADIGGNGQNEWYHIPSFAALELCTPGFGYCGGLRGAYINGNNKAECDTGNGATSCLVGRFVSFVTEGTVSAIPAGGSGTKLVGVQMIR